MEDRRLRIPQDPLIRADLRQVTKQVTSAGNVRFTAERTADGHADHFWGLGLAIHAAASPAGKIEFTALPGKGGLYGKTPDDDDDYSVYSNKAGAW
jgi:phage FluMu gp28-like protein